jgi:hypothetical protein
MSETWPKNEEETAACSGFSNAKDSSMVTSVEGALESFTSCIATGWNRQVALNDLNSGVVEPVTYMSTNLEA